MLIEMSPDFALNHIFYCYWCRVAVKLHSEITQELKYTIPPVPYSDSHETTSQRKLCDVDITVGTI